MPNRPTFKDKYLPLAIATLEAAGEPVESKVIRELSDVPKTQQANHARMLIEAAEDPKCPIVALGYRHIGDGHRGANGISRIWGLKEWKRKPENVHLGLSFAKRRATREQHRQLHDVMSKRDRRLAQQKKWRDEKRRQRLEQQKESQQGSARQEDRRENSAGFALVLGEEYTCVAVELVEDNKIVMTLATADGRRGKVSLIEES